MTSKYESKLISDMTYAELWKLRLELLAIYAKRGFELASTREELAKVNSKVKEELALIFEDLYSGDKS